jgi:preprotein translocase subunit SecA
MLQKEGITHQVLNAKHHAREAEIIAQAGRPTMVTIATNMAGRGTDIVLGGSITKQLEAVRLDESRGETEKQLELQRLRSEWQVVHDQVVSAGGLHIVGTERHESRRIDNQLRGRSGRQGDPGSSRFYLALDDPLLRIFAGEKVAYFMQKLKMEEGEAIEHTMVTRSIEGAQRKVEQRNFDIRKQLLEYDDVANDQRKVIYQLRNEILDHESATDLVNEMRNDALGRCFRGFVPEQSVEEQWEIAGLERALANEFALDLPVAEWLKKEANLDDEQMLQRICDEAGSRYRAKAEGVGLPIFQQIERRVLLDSLDNHWREHLSTLDHLRQGIHLRAFAQKNPKQEYKREAFELFKDMLDAVRLEVTTLLILVEVRREQQVDELPRQQPTDMQFTHDEFASPAESTEQPSTLEAEPEKQRPYRAAVKVGRNEPCPCGSGKKYKQCHGRLA